MSTIKVSFECKSSYNAMLLLALHELLELPVNWTEHDIQDMSAFACDAIPCIADEVAEKAPDIARYESAIMGRQTSSAPFRALVDVQMPRKAPQEKD